MQLFYPGGRVTMNNEYSYAVGTPNTNSGSEMLYLDGKKIVGVADACNALELFVLYLGFLIAYPSSVKRKLLFHWWEFLLFILPIFCA